MNHQAARETITFLIITNFSRLITGLALIINYQIKCIRSQRTTKMAKAASEHGKAFEFAVINSLQEAVAPYGPFVVVDNKILQGAKTKFLTLSEEEQIQYRKAADVGVEMLIRREPKIEESLNTSILNIFLQSDQKGQSGDVRDIVLQRESENWEVGISAKHNHKAMKSSRLARELNFGKSWLQESCSDEYLCKVMKIFDELSPIINRVSWKSLGEKKLDIYESILLAFKEELMCIYKRLGSAVPERLIRYLIGNWDFHKIMKIKDKTQLQPFNLNGTLGQRSKTRRAAPESELLPLPSKIYDIHFKNDLSRNTLYLACDAGWQVSLRIHNASEMVESSLKFDITLIGHPPQLVTQEQPWK